MIHCLTNGSQLFFCIYGRKGDFGTILTYRAFTLTELLVEVVRSSRPVSRGSTNLWLTCRASQRHSADTTILLNGYSCAPLLANLFLFFYEYRYLINLIKNDIFMARRFNNYY